jgi:hypothetical protein
MHEFLPRYMEVSQITLATSTLSYIYIYIYIYIYKRHNSFERTLRRRDLDIEVIATRYGLHYSGSNPCSRNIRGVSKKFGERYQ